MATQRNTRHPQQSPLEVLTDGLTPGQFQEFVSAIQYLDERMNQPGDMAGVSPEGSIGVILNRLSPAVRERFALLSNVMETPRIAPFTPKMTEADHANAFGLDPENTLSAKAALDGLDVMGKLQQRMGTDKDRPQQPLTLREQVAAAMERHHE